MRFVVLLLLVASCAHSKCFTRCGLETETNDCVSFRAAEDQVLKAYAENAKEFTPAQLCAAVHGWRVFIHDRTPLDLQCRMRGAWWIGLCILGYTHTEERLIELPDQDWLKNAFAHEMAHVLAYELNGEFGHCGWEKRGLKAAIQQVTGEFDPTAEEERCSVPKVLLP